MSGEASSGERPLVPNHLLMESLMRIEERLTALQGSHQDLSEIVIRGGALKATGDATELKLRGECITTAIHMNKGAATDLVIIEAEKLYQFLKGQSLTHGNKVH